MSNNIFVEKKVFDPGLTGKPVYINGYAKNEQKFNRVFLVSEAKNEYLYLVNSNGQSLSLHIDDFDGLSLKVLSFEVKKENKTDDVDKKEKPTYKRLVKNRRYRSDKEIQIENDAIESILRQNIEPMQLMDIIDQMHELGFKHWTNKNASSFVQHAIQCGMSVIKEGFGRYSYNWKNNK